VMTPGGIFLSYDTRYPNPWNRHTRPLPAPELSRAFEGWFMETWSLTGLPPLLRLLAPWSLPLCRALESVPVLRSHLLTLARKP